ncbi:RNA dependent RNA polymerase-domain-containing protein, partial [Russula brevipes]
MEIELTRISRDADVYDVRKAVEHVLHGPDLYDPNDRRNKGRVPNFEIEMGKSPAGRIHNSKAILRVSADLGLRLLRWYRESDDHNIVVDGRPLRAFNLYNSVRRDALYIDPDQERFRGQIEESARRVRPRIASIQFGVWYKPSDSPSQGRSFSVEYEREFLRNSAAYISVVYEHKIVHIDIGQRETEETNFLILIKFSSIQKLGLGYDDCGQPYIVFDLRTPPNFEQESYNNRVPEGIVRKGRFKTRDRISAIDDGHAAIAQYAHHLRVVLSNPDDLLEFEKICHIAQCEPRPIRVPRVDVQKMRFSPHAISITSSVGSRQWTGRMPSRLRRYSLSPSRCAKRTNTQATASHECGHFDWHRGHILCHHVIVTPSRILLEGPYTTQSNRTIRKYQDHDPALAERFIRVEFRDEDRLAYRWDGDVDGTWFLQQRVGGTLRHGFEIAGRAFEFLAYSSSALREHSVWYVAPFRDPVDGYVTAETIRSSLGDFSKLLRTPKQVRRRIAQAFTATDASVKIRRDQWEEQDDLGPDKLEHTDGVGTISPELADMIWKAICNASRNIREHRVKPSAYQFRFLGYKGVVVVDHRLKGILMRLRPSQRKFPVHDVEEADFEIARVFDYPNPVHLNRPAVMALEDQGTDKSAVKSAFFEKLLRFSINHSLREVKYKARIPVPHSYQLVGVADEGQAYIKEGAREEDVFTLGEGRIYVCIQESATEPPVYFKGTCVISRSPVIHPGDVQRVYAVGEPPEGKLCFFRGLKNVVVLPAVGDRSLASMLAGGDLDGDTYDIYYENPGLLPTIRTEPAEPNPSDPWTLDEDRGDATVEDICDFIVEYINSDVMGLLADRHIVIADQSNVR